MSQPDPLAPVPCPNCRQPMQAKDLETHAHGAVRVDLCFACAGFWFDPIVRERLRPATDRPVARIE
jgi:Zn-finger nucleic acid-binding protein